MAFTRFSHLCWLYDVQCGADMDYFGTEHSYESLERASTVRVYSWSRWVVSISAKVRLSLPLLTCMGFFGCTMVRVCDHFIPALVLGRSRTVVIRMELHPYTS
jgi:hypothetical protein